jgi:hypothetical protein
MRRRGAILNRFAAILTGVTVATISSMSLSGAALAVAPQAASSAPIPTVKFMSPDEYRAFYQAKFGTTAPANPAASGYAGLVRSENGTVIDTRVAAGSSGGAQGATGVTSFDPSPGGSWSSILWSDTDRKGRTIPTRQGDSSIGYNHYVIPHNLYTSAPFRVIRNTRNAYIEQGAHLEYRALLTNLSNGSVVITVRMVAQAATRTDDGRYVSLDGKYMGTITAYCEGVTLCPSWVNSISG